MYCVGIVAFVWLITGFCINTTAVAPWSRHEILTLNVSLKYVPLGGDRRGGDNAVTRAMNGSMVDHFIYKETTNFVSRQMN
jgi:hypothetical protein